MHLKEVKSKAKDMGIKAGRMRKLELIRLIQAAEGFPQCYAAPATVFCQQHDCCWQKDCRPVYEKAASSA